MSRVRQRPAIICLQSLSPASMASSAIAMPPMSSTIPRVRTMTHIRCRPKNTLPRHVRSFNTSKPAPAIHGASAMPKNMMAQMPPQQGIRSRMKDLGRQEIPNDLGLMPMTLIRPPGKDLPSLFGADWKYRIKFEWLWVKTRFQNFFTYAPHLQPVFLLLTTDCL